MQVRVVQTSPVQRNIDDILPLTTRLHKTFFILSGEPCHKYDLWYIIWRNDCNKMRHCKKYILLIRNDKMELLRNNCNPQNLFIKSWESLVLKYKEAEKRVMFKLVYRCSTARKSLAYTYQLSQCSKEFTFDPSTSPEMMDGITPFLQGFGIASFLFHDSEALPFSLICSNWFRFAGHGLVSLRAEQCHKTFPNVRKTHSKILKDKVQWGDIDGKHSIKGIINILRSFNRRDRVRGSTDGEK